MKTIKNLIVFLMLIIVGLAVYIATQPSEYDFKRSRFINAPQEVLYQTISDLKQWPHFSPWLEKDPETIVQFGEKTSGKDAQLTWISETIGEATLTTISNTEYSEIRQHLNVVKPYISNSSTNWQLTKKGDSTEVTWSIKGTQDFKAKAFALINGSIEQNTGPEFERGLLKLDSLVQEQMAVYSIHVNGQVEHSGGFYLYMTTSCKLTDFESEMQKLMPQVGGYAISNNISFAGKPFVIYHKWDRVNNAVIFSACIPTTTKIVASEPHILTGQLLPFKAINATLKGNYKHLNEAWQKINTFANDQNLTILPEGLKLEIFTVDPSSEPNPANWITELFLAVEQ